MEAPVLPCKKALGPAPGQPADRGYADYQNWTDPRGPPRVICVDWAGRWPGPVCLQQPMPNGLARLT